MITQTCSISGKSFVLSEEDIEFYKNFDVPAPSLCPEERFRLLAAWRNERSLYIRKCGKTEKSIVSVFPEESDWTVYDTDIWYGDSWDAMEYGQEFDFSQEFFPQFFKLAKKVPAPSRSVVSNQNSDYINQAGWCKNCYLVFEADYNENCMYSNNIQESRYTNDCTAVNNCELCFECVDCRDSYELKYSQNSKNCSDSWFLKNCIGCKNCFGCINLRNKEYYFMNEKLSKEAFEKKLSEIDLTSSEGLENMRNSFTKFALNFPIKYMQGVQNDGSTGDYVNNCQRCTNCFNLYNSQDCKNVHDARNIKNSQDILVFGAQKGVDYSYFCHEIGDGVNNILFSDQIWSGCYDIAYSKMCVQNCHDLFGCVSLKKKAHCVLNKQYTTHEYENLRKKIIAHMKETGEWGQFFPAQYCPFGYNQTIAQDYFPLEKDSAREKGFWWYEEKNKNYQPQIYKIPEKITDVPDSICKEVLACKRSGKNFKIQKAELEFYRKMNLPIPRLHPDERHKDRMKLRNSRKLWKRTCADCDCEIQTTFNPERPEKVLCEECYLKVVQ